MITGLEDPAVGRFNLLQTDGALNVLILSPRALRVPAAVALESTVAVLAVMSLPVSDSVASSIW